MPLFAKKNRYYQGPVSDHFDGTRFFNPGGETPRGFLDVLKWQMAGGRTRWSRPQPALPPARPAPRVDDLTVTMVGHATLLIQVAGVNILTDPVWSDRASPFQSMGPQRFLPPGIDFQDLPPIDLILLSHNHYDHLDLSTLKRLHATHGARIITPLGNDAHLRPHLPGAVIDTVDWGHALPHSPLTLHALPCHHWSARGMGDRSMSLWAAFMITGPAGNVLHIGDTGFDEGKPYRDLPARFGSVRLAILPIGAYEPRWFMQAQHQNPDEAVRGAKLAGARHVIGHHWGTFQLTDEDRAAPVRALETALHQHDFPAERFRALAPGEVWTIPA